MSNATATGSGAPHSGVRRSRSLLRRVASVAAVGATTAGIVVLGLSGSALGSSRAHGITAKAASGGTATFAEGADATPDWIYPLAPGDDYSVANTGHFETLMYRPLYVIGTNGDLTLNTALSLAEPPVYSNKDRTVTIHLKSYRWSDGTKLTTRDIDFFLNLLEADKTSFWGYTPGQFPDNVASWTLNNASELTFHLKASVNPLWFTYNELSQITPLPQHAWDVEAAGGAVGNYDQTTAGAQSVNSYLTSQSQELSTYATNPLWQVVDGPWKLSSFSADGNVTFVPNGNYSGPVKPTLSSFVEEPFTSTAAEFNVLQSGSGLNVGYLPSEDISQKSALESAGFTITPWTGMGINYIQINFHNPKVGPDFQQLYVRQALQSLVDQPLYINKVYGGYGHENYGPVPNQPANAFYSPSEKADSYTFSPSRAVALLKAHGWKVVKGGSSTCIKPGSASDECGPGIAKHSKLSFNLLYDSGVESDAEMMQQFKSDASTAGIDISLNTAPFDTVFGQAVKCTSKQSTCKWQMLYYEGWGFGADVPTGEGLFKSTGSSNFGSYSSPEANKLINATLVGSNPQAMVAYQDYLAQQLPDIWLPGTYSFTAVSKNLKGVLPLNPTMVTPESWSFTG
jgi:peptide/nickel transport system substrate-binding protein